MKSRLLSGIQSLLPPNGYVRVLAILGNTMSGGTSPMRSLSTSQPQLVDTARQFATPFSRYRRTALHNGLDAIAWLAAPERREGSHENFCAALVNGRLALGGTGSLANKGARPGWRLAVQRVWG
jgi:hypothetical protein